MTAFQRIQRTLALAAVGFVTAGAGHAQTWDMDACTGGTKLGSGYTGCKTLDSNNTMGTLAIKAYSASSSSSNFATAYTSINNGGSYLGVWSGTENTGTSASTAEPHHAIDNLTSYGRGVELVHLQFSKAVDLGTLVANWTWSDGDFQVFRWNYSATTANPTITNFRPDMMPTTGTAANGWSLVHTGDFKSNLSQTIGDTAYYSSHWLVSTSMSGSNNNDGFKLGTITVTQVCQTSQTSTGGCAPTTNQMPEPSTMAMVLLAAVGATTARRRRRA